MIVRMTLSRRLSGSNKDSINRPVSDPAGDVLFTVWLVLYLEVEHDVYLLCGLAVSYNSRF